MGPLMVCLVVLLILGSWGPIAYVIGKVGQARQGQLAG